MLSSKYITVLLLLGLLGFLFSCNASSVYKKSESLDSRDAFVNVDLTNPPVAIDFSQIKQNHLDYNYTSSLAMQILLGKPLEQKETNLNKDDISFLSHLGVNDNQTNDSAKNDLAQSYLLITTQNENLIRRLLLLTTDESLPQPYQEYIKLNKVK